MGRRGPKPLSFESLTARGSRWAAGRTNAPGPTVEIGDTPPDELTGAARAEWDRLLPLLRDAGIVGETDAHCLADYCRSRVDYLETDSAIREQGIILKTPRGKSYINPLVRVRADAFRRMLELTKALGLSPMSRQSIKPIPRPPSAEPCGVAKYFFRPQAKRIEP